VKAEDADPPPKAIGVELVQDISAISPPLTGFLRRHRHRVKTILSNGSRTDTYVVDYLDRASGTRDAAVFAPYATSPTGKLSETRVLLRRQVRYAAWLVTKEPLTTELMAGVIEQGETAAECVVRELREEAGIEAPLSVMRSLGRPLFILPGTLTERIFPIALEVPGELLDRPELLFAAGDGSPFEEGAELLVLSLAEIERAIDQGRIADAKTELVISRLARSLEAATR
jgi:8-oxo-dGTP pyrophosphatase MutT (NUDIX family)